MQNRPSQKAIFAFFRHNVTFENKCYRMQFCPVLTLVLRRPTSTDLGNLSARVFAEMGLKPIDRDESVALLLARGEPRTSPVISTLRQAFP